MKSDRGFAYDPDAVEAAENGTLKLEASTEAGVEGASGPVGCEGTQCDCTGEPGPEGEPGDPTVMTTGFVAVLAAEDAPKPELDWNPHFGREEGDTMAVLEGAVCSQVLDAIKDAKGEPAAEPETFPDPVSASQALAAVGEAASTAAQAMGEVVDAVEEMKRKMKLVAEKGKQKLVRELRKADKKGEKTCANCHVRVPVEVIGGGRNDVCDACLKTL